MSLLHSYPKIFQLGHRAVADMLKGPVIVQEKVDGSQFSFGVRNGELFCRSKGVALNIEAPDKMFKAAVDTCRKLQSLLVEGWTYRGEYLAKPKHNALAYNRTPYQNIILFDINRGLEDYLSPISVQHAADGLNLETVPNLFCGIIESSDQIRAFLDRESVLGGQKIEGVVIKPLDYKLFGKDKKCLMAKFVSEDFKEVHQAEWKSAHPTNGDVIALLCNEYATPARWQKAVIHLREKGLLTNSPRDIGPLMKEMAEDVLAECGEEIKQKLFDYAWKQISRKLFGGLPGWYKEQLMKSSFEEAK